MTNLMSNLLAEAETKWAMKNKKLRLLTSASSAAHCVAGYVREDIETVNYVLGLRRRILDCVLAEMLIRPQVF